MKRILKRPVASRAGVDHATAHEAIGVITLDVDGQYAPEEIPFFVKGGLDDPSVFLIGARRRDQREGLFNWVFRRHRALAGLRHSDSESNCYSFYGSFGSSRRTEDFDY
jgi:hypothetical protein